MENLLRVLREQLREEYPVHESGAVSHDDVAGSNSQEARLAHTLPRIGSEKSLTSVESEGNFESRKLPKDAGKTVDEKDTERKSDGDVVEDEETGEGKLVREVAALSLSSNAAEMDREHHELVDTEETAANLNAPEVRAKASFREDKDKSVAEPRCTHKTLHRIFERICEAVCTYHEACLAESESLRSENASLKSSIAKLNAQILALRGLVKLDASPGAGLMVSGNTLTSDSGPIDRRATLGKGVSLEDMKKELAADLAGGRNCPACGREEVNPRVMYCIGCRSPLPRIEGIALDGTIKDLTTPPVKRNTIVDEIQDQWSLMQNKSLLFDQRSEDPILAEMANARSAAQKTARENRNEGMFSALLAKSSLNPPPHAIPPVEGRVGDDTSGDNVGADAPVYAPASAPTNAPADAPAAAPAAPPKILASVQPDNSSNRLRGKSILNDFFMKEGGNGGGADNGYASRDGKSLNCIADKWTEEMSLYATQDRGRGSFGVEKSDPISISSSANIQESKETRSSTNLRGLSLLGEFFMPAQANHHSDADDPFGVKNLLGSTVSGAAIAVNPPRALPFEARDTPKTSPTVGTGRKSVDEGNAPISEGKVDGNVFADASKSATTSENLTGAESKNVRGMESSDRLEDTEEIFAGKPPHSDANGSADGVGAGEEGGGKTPDGADDDKLLDIEVSLVQKFQRIAGGVGSTLRPRDLANSMRKSASYDLLLSMGGEGEMQRRNSHGSIKNQLQSKVHQEQEALTLSRLPYSRPSSASVTLKDLNKAYKWRKLMEQKEEDTDSDEDLDIVERNDEMLRQLCKSVRKGLKEPNARMLINVVNAKYKRALFRQRRWRYKIMTRVERTQSRGSENVVVVRRKYEDFIWASEAVEYHFQDVKLTLPKVPSPRDNNRSKACEAMNEWILQMEAIVRDGMHNHCGAWLVFLVSSDSELGAFKREYCERISTFKRQKKKQKKISTPSPENVSALKKLEDAGSNATTSQNRFFISLPKVFGAMIGALDGLVDHSSFGPLLMDAKLRKTLKRTSDAYQKCAGVVESSGVHGNCDTLLQTAREAVADQKFLQKHWQKVLIALQNSKPHRVEFRYPDRLRRPRRKSRLDEVCDDELNDIFDVPRAKRNKFTESENSGRPRKSRKNPHRKRSLRKCVARLVPEHPAPGNGYAQRRSKHTDEFPVVKLYLGEIFHIGRDLSNDIEIRDASVSRKHARIEVGRSGKIVLIDVGSSNGTTVDGVRLDAQGRIKLLHRSHVQFGDACYRFLLDAKKSSGTTSGRMDTPKLHVIDEAVPNVGTGSSTPPITSGIKTGGRSEEKGEGDIPPTTSILSDLNAATIAKESGDENGVRDRSAELHIESSLGDTTQFNITKNPEPNSNNSMSSEILRDFIMTQIAKFGPRYQSIQAAVTKRFGYSKFKANRDFIRKLLKVAREQTEHGASLSLPKRPPHSKQPAKSSKGSFDAVDALLKDLADDSLAAPV